VDTLSEVLLGQFSDEWSRGFGEVVQSWQAVAEAEGEAGGRAVTWLLYAACHLVAIEREYQEFGFRPPSNLTPAQYTLVHSCRNLATAFEQLTSAAAALAESPPG
jgi:hypothetical protein